MNNIDMILQSADLPEPPVEAISDERQAKILSGNPIHKLDAGNTPDRETSPEKQAWCCPFAINS